MYPEDFEFRAENSAGISFFDNLIGNGWIREAIENGDSIKDMEKDWKKELKEFEKVRKDYLIY